MSILTKDQLEMISDSFEDNFTEKSTPAIAKGSSTAKRAPRRKHGSWWKCQKTAKELVVSKTLPIFEDILSRDSDRNTITVNTISGTQNFRWSSAAPKFGMPMLMFSVVMASKDIEEICEFENRTEDAIMRRSDVVEWVHEAAKDAFEANIRKEQPA